MIVDSTFTGNATPHKKSTKNTSWDLQIWKEDLIQCDALRDLVPFVQVEAEDCNFTKT